MKFSVCSADTMSSRVLRTKEKIVAVRSFEEGFKLCAFDSQHPDNRENL